MANLSGAALLPAAVGTGLPATIVPTVVGVGLGAGLLPPAVAAPATGAATSVARLLLAGLLLGATAIDTAAELLLPPPTTVTTAALELLPAASATWSAGDFVPIPHNSELVDHGAPLISGLGPLPGTLPATQWRSLRSPPGFSTQHPVWTDVVASPLASPPASSALVAAIATIQAIVAAS